MTTTTGDPSSLKTPSSLSGGDLVSRLLAATPPYLYNVPLTPHSFFFSEMLRSFVQAKTSSSETSAVTPSSSAVTVNLNARRRKRSWRDARERPLELTTKEKSNILNDNNKYFHQDLSPDNRYKSMPMTTTDNYTDNYDGDKNEMGFEQSLSKPVDENRNDFLKNRHFFDDPSRLFNNNNNNNNEGENSVTEENRKNDSVNGMGFIGDKNNSKLDLKNQNYGLQTPGNTEFTPSPFWYPPYPIPPQSYPGIDPLHFFIDLRVSGHIWDRKINNERQPIFKSKHCSAFSVPQTVKEYNRPLNLTRDEAGAGASKNKSNYQGTHFIFKNLTKTYRDISTESKKFVEKIENKNNETVGNSSHQDRASPSSFKEDEETVTPVTDASTSTSKKDIRALIGLELVVDYVKEPKEEPQPQQQPQSPTNHNQ